MVEVGEGVGKKMDMDEKYAIFFFLSQFLEAKQRYSKLPPQTPPKKARIPSCLLLTTSFLGKMSPANQTWPSLALSLYFSLMAI